VENGPIGPFSLRIRQDFGRRKFGQMPKISCAGQHWALTQDHEQRRQQHELVVDSLIAVAIICENTLAKPLRNLPGGFFMPGLQTIEDRTR